MRLGVPEDFCRRDDFAAGAVLAANITYSSRRHQRLSHELRRAWQQDMLDIILVKQLTARKATRRAPSRCCGSRAPVSAFESDPVSLVLFPLNAL